MIGGRPRYIILGPVYRLAQFHEGGENVLIFPCDLDFLNLDVQLCHILWSTMTVARIQLKYNPYFLTTSRVEVDKRRLSVERIRSRPCVEPEVAAADAEQFGMYAWNFGEVIGQALFSPPTDRVPRAGKRESTTLLFSR